MSPSDITRRLTEVFHDVLDDEAIVLSRETTAEDIEAWDSLAQISLIVAIEKEFDISIDLAELNQFKNVGDMLDLIERKVA
jgi:acyl carrier protein